jgi:hypothetical protein
VLAPMLPDPRGAAPNQFAASSAIRPPRYLLLLLLLRAPLIGWKRRRKGLAGNDGASDTRRKVQSGHGKVRSATSVVPRPVMVRILGWSAASANFERIASRTAFRSMSGHLSVADVQSIIWSACRTSATMASLLTFETRWVLVPKPGLVFASPMMTRSSELANRSISAAALSCVKNSSSERSAYERADCRNYAEQSRAMPVSASRSSRAAACKSYHQVGSSMGSRQRSTVELF